MKIFSNAFDNGHEIPMRHTHDGDNLNPLLFFDDIPTRARSLALLVENPDAADGRCHWLIWNMPPYVREVFEGSPPSGVQGKNSLGRRAYDGPCPAEGEHAYSFTLFALDTMLDLPEWAEDDDFERAIDGHVIARAEYRGRYQCLKPKKE